MTLSPSSSLEADDESQLDVIAWAKQQGLIQLPGQASPIEKDGAPAAQLCGVRTQWMDVGPKRAVKWLENNFRNRPVSDDVVASYARDMLRGAWIPNHQGIAFNNRDELIDGQHRLLAIVKSGCKIRTLVTFGLPSEVDGKEMTTMDTVDRGRTRTVADQLKIQHGIPQGSVIAAACANLGGLCFGERTRRLTVGQTLEIYRAFEHPLKWVLDRRSKEHGIKQTGVISAFTFALSSDDDFVNSTIASMYMRLRSGDDLEDGTPLAQLRTFLTSTAAQLLRRGTDRGLAELVLQAIYLEQQGRRVESLPLGRDGVDHFTELQPVRVARIADIFTIPDPV